MFWSKDIEELKETLSLMERRLRSLEADREMGCGEIVAVRDFGKVTAKALYETQAPVAEIVRAILDHFGLMAKRCFVNRLELVKKEPPR